MSVFCFLHSPSGHTSWDKVLETALKQPKPLLSLDGSSSHQDKNLHQETWQINTSVPQLHPVWAGQAALVWTFSRSRPYHWWLGFLTVLHPDLPLPRRQLFSNRDFKEQSLTKHAREAGLFHAVCAAQRFLLCRHGALISGSLVGGASDGASFLWGILLVKGKTPFSLKQSLKQSFPIRRKPEGLSIKRFTQNCTFKPAEAFCCVA